jgi:iron complex outermembrane receptor protein
MDNTLQVNGSFYYYDYENIHTTSTEVSALGGTTTSVLAAPGAKITGAEVDVLWLATDNVTLGGNLSLTPSEYTADLLVKDPTSIAAPGSLYPDQSSQIKNINGNQLLQVPDSKFTTWGSYSVPLAEGNKLDFFGVYNWIDEVYYSPFQSENEKADAYGRLDLRATWTSAKQDIIVSAFVNNVLDDIGVLQVLRTGENEFFRQTAGTTVPRMYGLEFTYKTGAF